MRIDTHHHMIPPDYRKMLAAAGIDEAGGRALPDWSAEASLQAMAELDVATAILSVSTPGTTFLPNAADAAALARDLNDYAAHLVTDQPDRFGFFATVPMPHLDEAVGESVRALDELKADGVVLLANNAGAYLGEDGQDDLWVALNNRSAVVFIHPADLPGPSVPGVAPFAADFLLDTSRAAYLLVCNGIRRRYPDIKFILSHAGGFVPYASHRMALAITGATGRSPADSLDDFASFYFDTALSSTAAALPTLLCVCTTRSHHLRIGLSVRAAGRRTTFRRRPGELPTSRHRYPRLHRPHERVGPVSPTGHRTASDRSPSDRRVRHTISRGVMRLAARLMEA